MSKLKFSDKLSEQLPLYMITSGIKHVQEPRYRPSGASFHHIIYVEKGEGVFEVNGNNIIIPQGHAVFIRKDIPVNYRQNGDTFDTAWVTFDGVFVDKILNYFNAGDIEILQSDSIYSLITECHNHHKRDASPALLSSFAYHLITSFFTKLQQNEQSPALLRAKQYIENNSAYDISVSDIASSAGISQSLLFRLFHDEERMTPVEYLRNTRINKAQLLLVSSPELKISDVSEKCGFSDVSYFCKLFRQQTGFTPNTYRLRFTL